ncbi:hypothetical protein [Mycobacterium sp. SMC-14]|uniref:hypothetical protein n=1 Tax=Mycobacterium sp. SMC-14 TaxID=3385968 RepID=UPI00390C7112
MDYRRGGSVITVGSSGTLGIGGMVITDGRCGRWRCGGSLGGGACCAGGCCGGACRGGAADGAVVLGALDEAVVVLLVVLLVELLVVLDELVAGVVPPPGPWLVSWMIPQTTSAIMTVMSPNQAIRTDRRRNQGMDDGAAKSAPVGSVGSSKAL